MHSLAKSILAWVRPGGDVFFRESCFHRSGDAKRGANPTHYRDPQFYTKVSTFIRAFRLHLHVHLHLVCVATLFATKRIDSFAILCTGMVLSDGWVGKVFEEVRVVEDGQEYGLQLVSSKCLRSYVVLKKNQNQVRLLARRTSPRTLGPPLLNFRPASIANCFRTLLC